MAEEEEKDPCDTPFLRYLQSGPDTPYTCWFLVGDPEDQLPELISGCKLHLMAHSVPMRNMLYESEIAEEGTKENPVKILDVKPDTFRHFVKFINYFNNVPSLSLEEAVDLYYVAEKYIIEDLKTKLEQHIVSLLNENNVFVPMKQPECFQNETLKSSIEKIVQQKTKELFAKEEFLDLSSAELLHIVTQDTLAVNELELWREILRWAKYQAQSEEGGKLREVMPELLKHFRFCTLHMYDFCKEVVSTGILTPDEVFSINMVVGGKLDCEKPSLICYEQSDRNVTMEKNYVVKGSLIVFLLLGFNPYGITNYSCMFITTDAKGFQLLAGEFQSPAHGYKSAPKNLKVECNCSVSLTRITDYGSNTSTEQPVKFDFVKDVLYDTKFVMPFPNTMKLLPYNKYKLEFKFTNNFPALYKHATTVLTHQEILISWDRNESITHLRWLDYKNL